MANAAGVTAMFDAAIIIASVRMLVAATVTLVLFLLLLQKCINSLAKKDEYKG